MTSTLTLALRARNANRVKPRYQICLIHPFDPRGEKVGGLETYIRDFITFHPVDTDILFIGVDSTGELELGQLHRLTFRGRGFDFLPILHYSDQQAREAARTIRSSLTGQFFMALLRHFGTAKAVGFHVGVIAFRKRAGGGVVGALPTIRSGGWVRRSCSTIW